MFLHFKDMKPALVLLPVLGEMLNDSLQIDPVNALRFPIG